MNSETVTLIRELADRLGVTADRLIDLFIPRVVADAAFWLVVGSLGLIAIWYLMYRAYKADYFVDIKDLILPLAGAVFLSLILLAAIGSSIETFASPRAEAILEIIDAVKPE